MDAGAETPPEDADFDETDDEASDDDGEFAADEDLDEDDPMEFAAAAAENLFGASGHAALHPIRESCLTEASSELRGTCWKSGSVRELALSKKKNTTPE